MLGRYWKLAWVAGVVLVVGQDAAGTSPRGKEPGAGACKSAVLEGEVRAGESFSRPIGGGLSVRLDALSWGSGWALRIFPTIGLPKNTPETVHDYAQLATPPYSAVNPLLLSTDYSFRAQDAVAWNPRRFRYAANAINFARLVAAYVRYNLVSPPTFEAEAELAGMVSKEPEGTLQILDVRLIPGTANQAGTAALVASHFSTTAHTIEEPVNGRGLPLGKLTWVRFRITLELQKGVEPTEGMRVESRACNPQ